MKMIPLKQRYDRPYVTDDDQSIKDLVDKNIEYVNSMLDDIDPKSIRHTAEFDNMSVLKKVKTTFWNDKHTRYIIERTPNSVYVYTDTSKEYQSKNLPHPALILWAKSWISFRAKHPDWDIWRQINEVIGLDGGFVTDSQKDPYPILIAFDDIIKFYIERGKGSALPSYCLSSYSWENEIRRTMSICHCDRNEAIVTTIRSILMMLNILEFKVPVVQYSKHQPYTTGNFAQGMTYVQMGRMFYRQFKGNLNYRHIHRI